MSDPGGRDDATVRDRIAQHAGSDEPLTSVEVEAIRAGRCGPLRYGGPCWLMPNHKGPHHCYREDVDALVAQVRAETLAPFEALADEWGHRTTPTRGEWVSEHAAGFAYGIRFATTDLRALLGDVDTQPEGGERS